MAFVTMATDSKQLYLISHDHRTKKRKDFGCPSSLFFILSCRRCADAFEVYLECLAFVLSWGFSKCPDVAKCGNSILLL